MNRPGRESVPERVQFEYNKAEADNALGEARIPAGKTFTGVRYATGAFEDTRRRVNRSGDYFATRRTMDQDSGMLLRDEKPPKKMSLQGSEGAMGAATLEGLRRDPGLLKQLRNMLRDLSETPEPSPTDEDLDEKIDTLPIPEDMKRDAKKVPS